METCYQKADRHSPRISMTFYSCHPFVLGFLGFCMLKHLVNSQNHTLIFAKDIHNVRNCSCSTDIRSCDYSLANLMCNCKTVFFHKNRTASRLVQDGDLTVWFPDNPTLGQLLNFTVVHDLKLCLCGASPLPPQYLAILGLRRLRVQPDGAPEQNLTINNRGDTGSNGQPGLPSKEERSHHIAYLDTSLFNGKSFLKSYSIEDIPSITEYFPYLPYLGKGSSTSNTSYSVTLIY
ncbi:exosomal polycystin-1-interacting protein [Pelodytes ibericus]